MTGHWTLTGTGADRRDTGQREAWGVTGHWAVMGPGLLGVPPQARGVTGGDAGW